MERVEQKSDISCAISFTYDVNRIQSLSLKYSTIAINLFEGQNEKLNLNKTRRALNKQSVGIKDQSLVCVMPTQALHSNNS